IDVIGLEPPERLLAGGRQRLAARATTVRIAGIEVAEELRGDDDAIAARAIAADGFADDRFRVAFRVHVGRVDEIAAAREIAAEDGRGLRRRRSPAPVLAEGHRAEAERADAQPRTSKRDVVSESHDR